MTKMMAEEEIDEGAKRKAEGMIQTRATPEDYRRGAERMADYWDVWAKRYGTETQEALKKVRETLGR
jgi:TRAP-type C4-dicarboxylate transport system substrate-binding protein